MSAHARDETRVFRHVTPGCVVCGSELRQAGTGRRRSYCSASCRQRAYRLRDEARRPFGAVTMAANPAEVTALLNAVLGLARKR